MGTKISHQHVAAFSKDSFLNTPRNASFEKKSLLQHWRAETMRLPDLNALTSVHFDWLSCQRHKFRRDRCTYFRTYTCIRAPGMLCETKTNFFKKIYSWFWRPCEPTDLVRHPMSFQAFALFFSSHLICHTPATASLHLNVSSSPPQTHPCL